MVTLPVTVMMILLGLSIFFLLRSRDLYGSSSLVALRRNRCSRWDWLPGLCLAVHRCRVKRWRHVSFWNP